MPGLWSDGELDALIEEIVVDAYNDDEKLSSFECAFDESGLPAAAVAFGMAVALMKVFSGGERVGLEADVLVEGRTRRIRLLDIEITESDHDAVRVLAAFRRMWVP